uniref:hypothetical protein n=1 Tax=Candidatus Electrothrix sp. TaxID=2170559 RepID=UPI004056C0F9
MKTISALAHTSSLYHILPSLSGCSCFEGLSLPQRTDILGLAGNSSSAPGPISKIIPIDRTFLEWYF